ncbi:hypothetical protein, partial [Pelomonas sp. KK5]|uniref:hypothetical protein n=1 Tax=Pelomonas sp. KK5 TaxID=1855730 RepID=UPI00097C24BB
TPVAVRDGQRLWLVGSGPTPALGRALACALREASGRAVTDVVNTHVAPELSLGNSAFPRARLWALPEVIAAMQQRCGQCLSSLKEQTGAALAMDDIRVPAHAVRAGQPLGPFDTLALPRQQGEPTLLLRDRRSGLVIAQGLLWAGAIPDLHGTDSALMLDALDALQRFAGDAPVLGQQGPSAGHEGIEQQRRYLVALRAAVNASLAAGRVEQVLPLPEFATLPGYAELHPLNVQRVWRELEAELFR